MNSQDNPPPPSGGGASGVAATGSRTSSPSSHGGSSSKDAAGSSSSKDAAGGSNSESSGKSGGSDASQPRLTTRSTAGPATTAANEAAGASTSSASPSNQQRGVSVSTATSSSSSNVTAVNVSALPASFPSPSSRVSPTSTSPLPGIPSPPPASATTSQLRAAYYSRDRGSLSFDRPRMGSSTSGGATSVSNSNKSPVHGESSSAAWPQSRGQKRQLQQVYDQYPPLTSGGDTYARPRRMSSPGTGGSFMSRSGHLSVPTTTSTAAPASVVTSSSTAPKSPVAPRIDLGPPREDPSIYDPPGGDSQSPRDNTRYETWTSKQLRKKCSHLKLRGLKNVKKHVMVEALYRYYRNQRLKEAAAAAASADGGAANTSATNASSAGMTSPQRRHLQASRRRSPGGSSSMNAYGSNGAASDASSATSGRGNEWPSDGLGMADARTAHYDDGYYGSSSRGARTAAYHSTSSPPPGSSSALAGATNELRLQHARQVMARLAAPSGATPSGATPNGQGYHRYASADEETKGETLYKEVPVTSEDVVRLVDVVLSPEFVDRLTNELSRWQFWVDIREKYVSLLQRHGPSVDGSSSVSSGSGERSGSGSNAPRNFKWSSMQLWEIWKELTFAYTKTCFEFTAAGVDEQEFINFCDGRPDVYYLHQRLHARPDLLHLIKSNEYIDEKYVNDAADHHYHPQPQQQRPASASSSQQQQASQAASSARGGSMVALMSSSGNRLSPHKRYKRSASTASQAPGGTTTAGGNASSSAFSGSRTATTAFHSNSGASGGTGSGGSGNNGNSGSGSGNGNNGNESTSGNDSGDGSSGNGNSGSGSGSGSSGNSPNALQEEGSTENSETTGEDGSNTTANSNASGNSGGSDDALRTALAEQKYFSLLLQNFETIFESLHNKKILLANLRKDKQAPDHLITDLHNDIHVLSALKKEFRNKLRRTLH